MLQATTQQGYLSNFAEDSFMASAYLNDESEDFYHRVSEKPSCHETQRVLSDGVCSVGAGVYVEPEVHLRNCVVLPRHTVTDSAFHQIII